MIATGIDAKIEDEEEPSEENSNLMSWNTFISDEEYGLALKEYLYIICHQLYDDSISSSSTSLISKHYYELYEKVYKHCIDTFASTDSYPVLKTRNPSAEEIFSTATEGEVSEACFQFAVFYLCRELAKISGYFHSDINTPLNIQAENKENIFCTSRINDRSELYLAYLDYIEENPIAQKYKSIVYKKNKDIEDDELFNLFTPYQSVLVFFNILTDNNDLTQNLKKKDALYIIKKLNDYNTELLNDIAKIFFQCLTGNNTYRTSMLYGVGDGGSSTGFLGIPNLGLFLYKYTYDNQKKRFWKHIEDKIDYKIEKSDVLHFYVYGYEQENESFSHIDIKAFNQTLSLQGKYSTYNGIRSVRDSRTSPTFYNLIDENSKYRIAIDGYTTDYFRQNHNVAVFYRVTNDMVLNFPSVLSSVLKTSIHTANDDEIFVMMNVSPSVDNINNFSLVVEDCFEDNKFEIKTSVAELLFSTRRAQNFFKNLIEFLKHTDDSVIPTPIVEGYYVGKHDTYRGTVPDKTIKPVTTNGDSKEDTDDKVGNEKLRYSQAYLHLDKDNKEFTIRIGSTTSPRRSRLDYSINSPNIDENNRAFAAKAYLTLGLNNYTNGYTVPVGNVDVPFYNQPLAMLRSMGVLEAIAKEICRIDFTMKGKMDLLMSKAFAVDKSAESREDSDTSYQLENTISYATYKSFKWYKDLADYNQYDHSINFNE